jgi:hypothetical protein
VNKPKDTPAQQIDALMEQASAALVKRDYFRCERLCLDALTIAQNAYDYTRLAAIVLPLQESRRQKHQLAADAGKVFTLCDELPQPGDLRPGCYLICPPRVGLDARQLRELCDRQEVPACILAREPSTSAGMWPVVAIGPVTVRTCVRPPAHANGKKTKSKSKAKEPVHAAKSNDPAGEHLARWRHDATLWTPDVEWFESACEALGDAAIAQVDMGRAAAARVDDLIMRLHAVPDHEKLHQRLHEAAIEAARIGKPPPKASKKAEFDEEEDDDRDTDADD